LGIIFDLDQTLVDSTAALSFRSRKDWTNTYKLIPSFTIYEGLRDVFQYLTMKKISVVIVTSSPATYCTKVADHFSIPYIKIIGFHDTVRRKPHPDPIIKAIAELGLPKHNIISFGDDPKDIIASKAAGVYSVGCLWGSSDSEALMQAKANHYISTPVQIIELIEVNNDRK